MCFIDHYLGSSLGLNLNYGYLMDTQNLIGMGLGIKNPYLIKFGLGLNNDFVLFRYE
jgi:hypothetical protein